jgi:WD40 repeat protein
VPGVQVWDLGRGLLHQHTALPLTSDRTMHKRLVAVCSKLRSHHDRSLCAQVWDLGRGFCTNTLPCHSSVNAVRITVDSTMVVSGHFDGTLRFWDLRSARLANEVTGLHTQQITSVAVGLRTGENHEHVPYLFRACK